MSYIKSRFHTCQTPEGVADLLMQGYYLSKPWRDKDKSEILNRCKNKTDTTLVGYTPSSTYEVLKSDPRFKERLTMEPGCGPWYCLAKVDDVYAIQYEVKVEYVNRPNTPIEL